MNVLWLLLGAIGGSVFVRYAHSRGRENEMRILSMGLLIAAAIYIGFALLWGTFMWVSIETAGMLLYGIFVWLAYRTSYYWLAVGWALHPAWDVLLHLVGPGHAIAPTWYMVSCISFDVIVAGYIFYSVAQRQAVSATTPA